MLCYEQRLKMLEPPKGKFDMVLDTDAFNEVDDQFAISYALKTTNISMKALYAAPFFNEHSSSPADGMERSYQEILNLLQLADLSVDVFRGSDRFLPDEKTPVLSPSAEDLVKRAAEYTSDNPLYVVAIGAITNIASALLMDPTIADRVVVVWLGGNALEWPHNAEFNCMQDVAAVRVVFGSGVPLVILPAMGVVSAFTTTGPELHAWLDNKNPLCDYLVRHTVETVEKYAKGSVWSRAIWDVAAIGWLLNGDGKFEEDKLISTPVPQYDHHYSTDFRRPLCKYVYHINRDALFADLFDKISK